nr:hypothetical protein Iba_chr09aCG13900 [Ipomoea batatas]
MEGTTTEDEAAASFLSAAVVSATPTRSNRLCRNRRRRSRSRMRWWFGEKSPYVVIRTLDSPLSYNHIRRFHRCCRNIQYFTDSKTFSSNELWEFSGFRFARNLKHIIVACF